MFGPQIIVLMPLRLFTGEYDNLSPSIRKFFEHHPSLIYRNALEVFLTPQPHLRMELTLDLIVILPPMVVKAYLEFWETQGQRLKL